MENKSQPLTEALFYILLAARKPVHGYGIIQEAAELTGGRLNLGPGTLYGAITSLLDKGWIALVSAETGSRKKKEYLITEAGRAAFYAELSRLRELVANGGKMEGETCNAGNSPLTRTRNRPGSTTTPGRAGPW